MSKYNNIYIVCPGVHINVCEVVLLCVNNYICVCMQTYLRVWRTTYVCEEVLTACAEILLRVHIQLGWWRSVFFFVITLPFCFYRHHQQWVNHYIYMGIRRTRRYVLGVTYSTCLDSSVVEPAASSSSYDTNAFSLLHGHLAPRFSCSLLIKLITLSRHIAKTEYVTIV